MKAPSSERRFYQRFNLRDCTVSITPARTGLIERITKRLQKRPPPRMMDLSESGVRVTADAPFQEGRDVRVSLVLHAFGDSINSGGKVIRCVELPRQPGRFDVAVRFSVADRESHRRISVLRKYIHRS